MEYPSISYVLSLLMLAFCFFFLFVYSKNSKDDDQLLIKYKSSSDWNFSDLDIFIEEREITKKATSLLNISQ